MKRNRLFFCVCFVETDAGKILESFGSFFFEFCEEAGYDVIMRTLGSTVREFLEVIVNLNALFPLYSPGSLS